MDNKIHIVDPIRIKLKKLGFVALVVFLIEFLGWFLLEMNMASLELGVLFLAPIVVLTASIAGVSLTFFLIKERWYVRLLYVVLLVVSLPFIGTVSAICAHYMVVLLSTLHIAR